MTLFRKLRDGVPPDTYIGTNIPNRLPPQVVPIPDAPIPLPPPPPPPPEELPDPPNGVRCIAYSFTFPDYPFLGTPPINWAFSGLPTCLNADSMGTISGIPCTAGVFDTTAVVVDSTGATKIFDFSITIADSIPQILFPGEY